MTSDKKFMVQSEGRSVKNSHNVSCEAVRHPGGLTAGGAISFFDEAGFTVNLRCSCWTRCPREQLNMFRRTCQKSEVKVRVVHIWAASPNLQ